MRLCGDAAHAWETGDYRVLRTLGNAVEPIMYSSMPLAASRPSASAQTTRDCPRAISPAANMPGMLVI